jgi:hypothetical protein
MMLSKNKFCIYIIYYKFTLNCNQCCHVHVFTMHFTQHSPNFEWERHVPFNVGWMLNGMYNEMGTCFVVVWTHNNALEESSFQSLDKEFKSIGSPIVHYTLNFIVNLKKKHYRSKIFTSTIVGIHVWVDPNFLG